MAKLVTREMTDLLVLDLVDKGLVTDQMVLTVGYDIENLADPDGRRAYRGPVTTDPYGRKIPKHAHGTVNLHRRTSSTRLITEAVMELYDRIVDPGLLVRRINIVACRVIPETAASCEEEVQLNLFYDAQALQQRKQEQAAALERERRRQRAVIDIKKKYGKNAIIKGMNLEEGATAMDRNRQIGGHKA
jgi:DNA polymerase V